MGLFLMMSGVANSTQSAVVEALQTFATAQGEKMKSIATRSDPSGALLVADSGNHVSVLYPEDFAKWDEASEHLSRTLNTSVFSFHIHDGDFWMYILFSQGTIVDQFNPIPNYWEGNISDDVKQSWAGNADVVCQHWPNMKPEMIKNYLVTWDLDEVEPNKAYPDDEFSFSDWQLTDFMRRLGLVYPIDEMGAIKAACYRFTK